MMPNTKGFFKREDLEKKRTIQVLGILAANTDYQSVLNAVRNESASALSECSTKGALSECSTKGASVQTKKETE